MIVVFAFVLIPRLLLNSESANPVFCNRILQWNSLNIKEFLAGNTILHDELGKRNT